MSRKLKMIKATEFDRVTPKEINRNGIDYDELLVGKVFEEFEPAKEGQRAFLVCERGYNLHTSTVSKIEETEEELILTTRNTIYFFKIIK